MEEVLQKDPKIFFLNNLLMSVQFFENYERDVELLRQNWLKEFSIESHNKKCFYADSLFKLVGRNVKFSPPHEGDTVVATQLHPFRIYITSDNVEAAYDPSALKTVIEPQYQFVVKPAEENEKSGYVTMTEFKRREARSANKRPYTIANVNKLNDAANSYGNTEENSTASPQKLHSGEAKPKISGRQSSLRFFPSAEAPLPANGLYEHTDSEAMLKRKTIQDFRMNSLLATSQEIPMQCFQTEEVKREMNLFSARRAMFRECTRSQKVLKSTAFKAYFCDLLIEKLTESLSLDKKAVNESTVSGEFIIVNQGGTRFYISPAIPVRDWNNFVTINKKYRAVGKTEVVWPSNYMQKVINLLPCNAVPIAPPQFFEESTRHEKMWTLVFPKAEEFLLLHMMHAHIRCYLFAMLLYKSFIESEVSEASFGPKHLMHLLFWRVQKNFFAWPEDRPAETLLNYLKVLYKKLQNKSLCDFFMTSRNLFAGSLAKDLHKAQTLLKRIIENPVLYVGNAVRNLVLEPNYYPGFDVLKLKNSLREIDAQVAGKRKGKGTGKKKRDVQKVNAQEDDKKNATELIDVEEILAFESPNPKKCGQVLETFTSHFVQIGFKSLEYGFLSQALLYLSHSEKLLEFKMSYDINETILNSTRKKILDLREACYAKLKTNFPKLSLKQFQAARVKPRKNFGASQIEEEKKPENLASSQVRQSQDETTGSDERDFNEDEVFTVKL